MNNLRLNTDRGSHLIVDVKPEGYSLSYQYTDNITGQKYEVYGNGFRAIAMKVENFTNN
jgi:hypothetical protein